MVEHHLDMVVVGGSIPLVPTNSLIANLTSDLVIIQHISKTDLDGGVRHWGQAPQRGSRRGGEKSKEKSMEKSMENLLTV